MDGDQVDGGAAQPPAPRRRPARPLRPPGTARVAALDGLLRDIDDLRRTLETDLSLAAGAVDAGAPDLAASLLDGDRLDVARFEQRALVRLQALADVDAEDDLVDDLAAELAAARAAVTPLPAGVVALPRRRSRLARLLPAAPMVAAAAALVGFLGVVPSGPSRPAPEVTSDVSGALLSSWEELERLTTSDAPPEQVQRAARDLNAEIADMVASSDAEPDAARRALALLREAELVLSADDDAAELQQVLQQSRALAARLLASLPPVAARPPRLPATAAPAVPSVPALPVPVEPTAPPAARRSPEPAPDGAPAVVPEPGRSAAPASPRTSPSAPPRPSDPSPKESPTAGVLPRPAIEPL